MLRSGVSLFLSALPAWPAICFRGISLSQALSIIGFSSNSVIVQKITYSSNSVIVQKITATFLTNEMEYQLQLGCQHFPALQAISSFFPSFHLLLGIFPFVLIGHSDYCGFGCTTLIKMYFLLRESGTSSSQMGH